MRQIQNFGATYRVHLFPAPGNRASFLRIGQQKGSPFYIRIDKSFIRSYLLALGSFRTTASDSFTCVN